MYDTYMTTNRIAPLPELPLANYSYTVSHYTMRHHDEDSFDLDAPYQRGSVWTVDQRRNLIRSLLMGVPVGAVVIGKLPYDRRKCYRIIDGKQRIEAVRAFEAGTFSVPGWWFHADDLDGGEDRRALDVTYPQLSRRGRARIDNAHLPALEFDSATETTRNPNPTDPKGNDRWLRRTRSETEMIAAEADVYLLINFGGVDQTDADRARATGIAKGPV